MLHVFDNRLGKMRGAFVFKHVLFRHSWELLNKAKKTRSFRFNVTSCHGKMFYFGVARVRQWSPCQKSMGAYV